jgi:hypothetical protein
MATRKNPIELALNVFSGGIVLVHPMDIDDLDDPSKPYADIAAKCHIYLIVTRPRLTFVPGSMAVEAEHTCGKFQYTKNGVRSEATFWFAGHPNANAVEIGDYPHTKLHFVTQKEILVASAYSLSFICDGISQPSLRDLEVVYVGMAYGQGDRSARDRLGSHSTLQRVLADLNGDAPDLEALLLMVEYKPPVMAMSIDGRAKSVTEAPRNVGAALVETERIVTENIQIALVEASLIRYFAPKYNQKYKERFPHASHKILERLYQIDYAALTIEINTEDINARLFSPSRDAGYHHISHADLHDPIVRQSFYNIFNDPSGPTASELSGPFY